jgi:gamma-glutamyl hercynylcysteine S-oxide synthase
MVRSYTISSQKQLLRQWFAQSRSSTLNLLAALDREVFCNQAHPDFSPVGWHLGHIGYTESLWLLRRCAGLPPVEPAYDRLFAADSLPKRDRTSLPAYSEICDYLDRIRQQTFSYLEQLTPTELQQQERLWRWLLQHESQHCETITLILQMLQMQVHAEIAKTKITTSKPQDNQQAKLSGSEMVLIPAGNFVQGYDAIDALDNEQGEHQVYLPSYWIDRYPVTRGAYQAFIDAGGYKQKHWWSEAGWQWLGNYQKQLIATRSPQPLYWESWPANDEHPVCGVNWYEANAYAQFCGKRLLTEAEWEKAARWNPSTNQSQIYPWGDTVSDRLPCNYNHNLGMSTPVSAFPQGQSAYGCDDMLGNVWEWTATTFQPYPSFGSFPYAGYSSTYFDDRHYVLKGGSWATRPWALRASFRNWYHPHVRQIFAGFRCAKDA